MERIGWRVKRQRGSHRLLSRPEWPDYEFTFHDQDEIGPQMLARIAKRTGLRPEDLWFLTLGLRGVMLSVFRAQFGAE